MYGKWQLPPTLACEHCDIPLFYRDEQAAEIFRRYFQKDKPYCPACANELDWWSTVLHAIKGQSRHTGALKAIGAHETAFEVSLNAHTPVTLQFNDYGVPTDAQILRISYFRAFAFEGEGLIPLEMHGPTPYRYGNPREITLYPATLNEKPVDPTRIIVSILWVPHSADDHAWHQLIEAFDAYEQQQFVKAIVPSNVAVESLLTHLLTSYLTRIVSKDNVDDFLQNSGYSSQLNVVLPAVVHFTSAPKLNDFIRGKLNRLRKLRNEIVHTGTTPKGLGSDEVAELLCAALFWVQYLKFIRPILLGLG